MSVYADLEKDGQRIAFRCPYDVAFLDELKARIPHQHREWDGKVKAWAVTREHWPTARSLLRKHYGAEAIKLGPAMEAAEIELMEDDIEEPDFAAYAVLGVRSDAPECVIHAAMFAIGHAHHALADAIRDIDSDPGTVRDGVEVVDPYAGWDDAVPDLSDAQLAYARICAHRGIAATQGADGWRVTIREGGATRVVGFHEYIEILSRKRHDDGEVV